MIGVREDNRGRIHLGDVIIAVDDEPVTNQEMLLEFLERHQPGDKVKVTSMREDEIHTYELELAAPD